MNEYYFLFFLALVWTICAVVQDLKKREVANWLNFSLIAIALSYRIFYAITNKSLAFALTGLIGFALFFALANLFYYSKVFAGGDAKLLMGFGIILPYKTLLELSYISLIFIFLLFLLGSIYGILYSITIVRKNKQKFFKEFKKNLDKNKYLVISIIVLLIALGFILKTNVWPITSSFGLALVLLYIYTKSLEPCMISLVPAKNLQEGDWLEQNIKIGKKTIKKSVHGLSFEEIKLLRKANRKVLIKEGIPFTPAFLLSLMALFFLISKYPLLSFFQF